MVSIIIRTKNEEKWISACLRAVFGQNFPDFEVVIVDNKSTDKTLEKVKAYDVKVVEINNFSPGKALNIGIDNSKGEILVFLSGHCIPKNEVWLENLVRNLSDERVAGVYGRQEPMAFTSDLDKRDLITVFGIEKKIQRKDPFFHNANSAMKRQTWEQYPFNEVVTNIEDRVWGKQIVTNGYMIVYEPEASVYHWHGINQNGDKERCRKIVKILDSLESQKEFCDDVNLSVENMEILALIPIKGGIQCCGKRPLLEYTVKRALDCPLIDRTIVSTDNPKMVALARKLKAEAPFLRPENLSMDYVDLKAVLQYSIEKLEEDDGYVPDIVVVLEATYPFRPKGLLEKIIRKLATEGVDTVMTVRPEYRTIWHKDEEGNAELLGEGFMPRIFKESPIYISLLGLGCVTYPRFLREGKMIGESVGILEVTDQLSRLEVRDRESRAFADKFIEDWWSGNG